MRVDVCDGRSVGISLRKVEVATCEIKVDLHATRNVFAGIFRCRLSADEIDVISSNQSDIAATT